MTVWDSLPQTARKDNGSACFCIDDSVCACGMRRKKERHSGRSRKIRFPTQNLPKTGGCYSWISPEYTISAGPVM